MSFCIIESKVLLTRYLFQRQKYKYSCFEYSFWVTHIRQNLLWFCLLFYHKQISTNKPLLKINTAVFIFQCELDFFSDDELVEIDDEPDPEKGEKMKAKDELNLFSDSSDEDNEEEQSLNDAGKELNAILKKEAGIESSEDEEGEDEDIDNEYSKSAVFMQGKT